MLKLVGEGVTFAAGFVIYNAFAMMVTQRRRQIGALRALGMYRRQVMGMIMLEAMFIGISGTLVGLFAGPLLGASAIAMMKMVLGEGLLVFAASSPSLSSYWIAAGLGIIVTLISVVMPARIAMRISPLVALRQETAPGIRVHPVFGTLVGLVGVLSLSIYLTIAPPGEWVQSPWDRVLLVSFILVWLVCLALILPAFIGKIGVWTRKGFSRLLGAAGRLVSDNLQRARSRVTLTLMAMAVSLAMIVSMTGYLTFVFDELFYPKLVELGKFDMWMVAPFDAMKGMAAYNQMESIELSSDFLTDLHATFDARARVVEGNFVIVPELSFLGSSYFSMTYDPLDIEYFGDFLFAFTEGDWETAIPLMQAGCGVLITPLVASRNSVNLGERFDVTGKNGPVECVVAGIGSSLVSSSLISNVVEEEFGISQPLAVNLAVGKGTDIQAFEADLEAFVDQQPGVFLTPIDNMTELQQDLFTKLPDLLNTLLILAIISAALGLINTTLISVTERQRELGLLRAVGASHRQVMGLVMGEAALMGFIGGVMGLVAGAGVTIIIAVVSGGNAWGYPELDLWGAALRSVQPAVLNGIFGVMVAPFISAAAAWFPARKFLQGSPMDALQPER
jgi:putative ABC transport system permease protein